MTSELAINLPDPRHTPHDMQPLEIIAVAGGELHVRGEFVGGDDCKVIKGSARFATVNCDCGEGEGIKRKWTVL